MWSNLRHLSAIITGLLVIATLSSCLDEQTPNQGQDTSSGEVEGRHKIQVVSAKLYPRGEPDGYGGKALEFVLDRVLEENSEVRYEVKIETQTGFVLEGQGFLTTTGTYDQPTFKWLLNVFLWHRRHDPDAKRERIEKEVNPGNIKTLSIRLTEEEGLFSPRTVVIAERMFENL